MQPIPTSGLPLVNFCEFVNSSILFTIELDRQLLKLDIAINWVDCGEHQIIAALLSGSQCCIVASCPLCIEFCRILGINLDSGHLARLEFAVATQALSGTASDSRH